MSELTDAKVAFLAAEAAYNVASHAYNRAPGWDYDTVRDYYIAARAELQAALAAYDKARANTKEGDR